VLYGTQEKVSIVKGEKGNMKKAVVKQTYSMEKFNQHIEEFISSSNVVTCPGHVVVSFQILEEIDG